MKILTMSIKDIEEKGMIAYKYIAGSHSQNLDGPDSDVDFHGVYLRRLRQFLVSEQIIRRKCPTRNTMRPITNSVSG